MESKQAVREVSKEIYCKYYHDSVYCWKLEKIVYKVDQVWTKYRNARRRMKDGEIRKEVKIYKDEILPFKNDLFDISVDVEDYERKKQCHEEWGVSMGVMEKEYLADQRSERKMECNRGVDPVWYRSIMKSQRLRERQEDYVSQREAEFTGKSMEQIDNLLREQEEIISSSPESSATDTPQKSMSIPDTLASEDLPPKKKKKLFVEEQEDETDEMPEKYKHCRLSERKVKGELYQTCANLSGQGFSIDECSSAILEVANGMFGRKWKKAEESKENFTIDTIPEKSRILEALRQIEAQSLNLVVHKMVEEKEAGAMVTLASDSTTRKQVGKFIGMGLHFGKQSALPLPLMDISGETREDIAEQLGMGIEILSGVSGVNVNDLMAMVDDLLTDSVDHNKHVNTLLQQMFDLDTPPGQIFCGTHTTLGFSSTMNKVVKQIEILMKLETILSKFMVGMELDSKNGSLAGQALDMMLKLVAPEYRHKSWNYHGLYTNYVEQRGLELTLFAYKDHRFGCLSRASAVLLNNLDNLTSFLNVNPQISNKLACLVRELINLPHLRVIFAAFSLLGVQLVEPFYANTIKEGATHSSLKIFYQSLYDDLTQKKADSSFLSLNSPFFSGVSMNLFCAVKESYGKSVITRVIEEAIQHEEDLLALINLMLPVLGKTLGRQRADYSLNPDEFPV